MRFPAMIIERVEFPRAIKCFELGAAHRPATGSERDQRLFANLAAQEGPRHVSGDGLAFQLCGNFLLEQERLLGGLAKARFGQASSGILRHVPAYSARQRLDEARLFFRGGVAGLHDARLQGVRVRFGKSRFAQ